MNTIGRSMTTLTINDHDVTYSKDGPITGADLASVFNLVKSIEATGIPSDDDEYESEGEDLTTTISDVDLMDPRPTFFD